MSLRAECGLYPSLITIYVLTLYSSGGEPIARVYSVAQKNSLLALEKFMKTLWEKGKLFLDLLRFL